MRYFLRYIRMLFASLCLNLLGATGAFGEVVDEHGMAVTSPVADGEVVHYYPETGLTFKVAGKVGFALLDGRVMTPAQWDDVRISGEYEEGGIWVKKEGLWGVLWPEGSPLFEPKFDDFGFFYHGQASVREDGIATLIDAMGNVIFRMPGVDRIEAFYDGVGAVVMSNMKYGFVDTHGKTVLKTEFEHIFVHEHDGQVLLIETALSQAHQIYTPDGRRYSDDQFEAVGVVEDTRRVVVKIQGKWGVIRENTTILPPNFDEIDAKDRVIWARRDLAWSMFDVDGNPVDAIAYDSYRRGTGFDEDWIFVRANGKSWVIDRDGKAVSPQITSGDCLDFYPEIGVVWQQNGKLGFTSNDHKMTTLAEFDAFDFSKIKSGKLIGKVGHRDRVFKLKAPGKKSAFFKTETKKLTDDLVLRRVAGRVGLTDAFDQPILETLYDEIVAYGHNLWVRQGSMWGLYNMERSAWTIPMRYHSVEPGAYDGVFYVSENGARSVVYEDGKSLTSPIYVDQIVDYMASAREKREWLQKNMVDGVIFRVGDKFGYASPEGNVILTPEFDALEARNGFFGVEKAHRKGVYSAQGRIIIAVEQDDIVLNSVLNGIIWYRVGDKWGLYRTNGQRISEPIYDHYSLVYHENAIRVHRGDSAYVLNYLGEQIYPPILADEIEDYSPDRGVVLTLHHKMGFADASGKIVIPAEYEHLSVSDWNFGVIWAQKDGKWGLLDTKGQALTPFSYDAHSSFSLGRANVYQGNLVGLIDTNGQPVVAFIEADKIETWFDAFGKAVFMADGKRGIATVQGDIVIPALYEGYNLSAVGNGYIWFKKDGKWGFYTTDGVKRTDAVFDGIGEFYHDEIQNEDVAKVSRNGVSYVVTSRGLMNEKGAMDAFERVQQAMKRCDLYLEQRIMPDLDVWKSFVDAVDDWHAKVAQSGETPDATFESEIQRYFTQFYTYSFQALYVQILSAHANNRVSSRDAWDAFIDTVAHMNAEKNQHELELAEELKAEELKIIMDELDVAMRSVREYHDRNAYATIEVYDRFEAAYENMKYTANHGGHRVRDYDDMVAICDRMESRQKSLFIEESFDQLKKGGTTFTTNVYQQDKARCLDQKAQYEWAATECRRAADLATSSPSSSHQNAYESQRRILANIRRGCDAYIEQDPCE